MTRSTSANVLSGRLPLECTDVNPGAADERRRLTRVAKLARAVCIRTSRSAERCDRQLEQQAGRRVLRAAAGQTSRMERFTAAVLDRGVCARRCTRLQRRQRDERAAKQDLRATLVPVREMRRGRNGASAAMSIAPDPPVPGNAAGSMRISMGVDETACAIMDAWWPKLAGASDCRFADWPADDRPGDA